MKINKFNEFFFFGGIPMDPKGTFEDLLKMLDEMTFDSQSSDEYEDKRTVRRELELRDGIDRLYDTFDRISKKDIFEEMPYEVVKKRAVDDLFDEIDIAIGTSSNQEKELRKRLSDFMDIVMKNQ